LHNAGIEDPIYFEKRIKYCREFCSLFPDENELIIHNMLRAIAESYICLKKFEEAKESLDKLVNDYPNNPWSYIEYGDMYWFGDDLIKDPIKAKEFYDKALKVAKDKYDMIAIEERMEDLNL
jgi:tetratricopeptide (TPR) repeat protein